MNLQSLILQHIKGNNLLKGILFLVASASFLSCSSGEDPYSRYYRNPCIATEDEKEVQKVIDIKAIKKYFRENNIDTSNMQVTASGIHYIPLEPGSGDVIKEGDRVEVHYIGKHLNGSTFDLSRTFDSSYNSGRPFQFIIGYNVVNSPLNALDGWDEGVQLMKVGETGRLYIPSYLAYGPCGPNSGSIGPNENLAFEIEVLRKL